MAEEAETQNWESFYETSDVPQKVKISDCIDVDCGVEIQQELTVNEIVEVIKNSRNRYDVHCPGGREDVSESNGQSFTTV